MNNKVSDEFFLRLEVVAQTNTEANHGGLTIRVIKIRGRCCNVLFSLGIRKNAIYIGALAQVILVTNRGHIVLEVEFLAGDNAVGFRRINVTDTKVTRTAGERSTGGSLKGVAFHLAERIQTNIRQAANLTNEDFVEVLRTGENLDHAEVIAAAKGDRQAVSTSFVTFVSGAGVPVPLLSKYEA